MGIVLSPGDEYSVVYNCTMDEIDSLKSNKQLDLTILYMTHGTPEGAEPSPPFSIVATSLMLPGE